ncbi:MAG: tetratricopeptide repeat protein [Verrucomicrobiales bacterium]
MVRAIHPIGRESPRRGRWLKAAAFGLALGPCSGQDAPLDAGAPLELAVRGGDAAAAARAMEGGAPEPEPPVERFWRAQAALLTGRHVEAAALFDGLTRDQSFVYFQEAVLSHGALWASRGETGRALRALEAGLESEDVAFLATLRLRLAELHLSQGGALEARAVLKAAPASLEKSALEARAAWMEGKMEDAAQLAGPVAAQASAGAARDTARLVQARVRAAAGQILEADRGLLEWVRAEPAGAPLPAVVLALEEFKGLAAEEVNTLFAEWKGDPRPALAPAAAYGQAAALASRDDPAAAATAFSAFAVTNESHPLASVARLRAVELALATGQAARARAWADAWWQHPSVEQAPAERSRAAFMVGLAAWQEGDIAAAVSAFEQAAAQAPDAATQRAARINVALSAVASGRSLSLAGLEGWPAARLTVQYEAALHAARVGRPEAVDWFEALLAELPEGDPRAPVAWSALVDLDLAAPTPAIAAARQHARAARRTATEPGARELADWLVIRVEAAADDWAAALAKSSDFLQIWPTSERAIPIRFHRAEWYQNQGDWAGAMQEYDTLAAEADTQPVAGARAMYLAGLAEINLPSPDSLDLAIDRWRDAAALDESFVFPARYQQALAKCRLGMIDEAIQQLDTLLTGLPTLTPAQKAAVQLTRGELLFLPAAQDQPDRIAAALEALQSVVDESPAGSPRRARALCRRGEAMALLGRTEEALATLTEAAQPLLVPPADSSPPAATVWPARAGLAAVSLLESRHDWTAAAALAQKLAASPGPHAAAAKVRASRLRLEHFIWEE